MIEEQLCLIAQTDAPATSDRRQRFENHRRSAPKGIGPVYFRASSANRIAVNCVEATMRILALVGGLAIAIGVVAGSYFLGGFYNIAASADDSGPIVSALTRVRTASISRHAVGQPPFALDDVAAIRDGARHFARYGCTHCHGAPGVEWSKFAEGLNPGAADLSEIAKEREAAAIFWVVKNGIRMTGMPSFGKAGVPDNELWQIAAFVKKLPNVSEADYKSWSASPLQ
jgi:hypothetical protein